MSSTGHTSRQRLQPKLLGKTRRKSRGFLRLFDTDVQIVQRSLETVAPITRPSFELLDLEVEPPIAERRAAASAHRQRRLAPRA
jgi:hypothetical protein